MHTLLLNNLLYCIGRVLQRICIIIKQKIVNNTDIQDLNVRYLKPSLNQKHDLIINVITVFINYYGLTALDYYSQLK